MERPNDGRLERGADVLLRASLIAVLCLFLASPLPGPLVPAALRELFQLAAIGAAMVAGLRGEALTAPRWTHWDAAAAFLAAGIAMSWLTDAAAVRQALSAAT